LNEFLTFDSKQTKQSFWSIRIRKLSLLAFLIFWLILYFLLAPSPLTLASQRWTLILTGFAGAMIGNLSAVGGGLVFIPVMIFICKLPPIIALKIALASQCVGMTSGAISWLGKTPVCRKALVFAVPALLIGSTVSCLLIRPNPFLIKALFGPVSIILGVPVLVTARKQTGATKSSIDSRWLMPVFAISLLGGLISGCVAVGEGEVVAAFLMLAAGVDSATSIATGVTLLAVTSIYLTIIHQFFLGGIPWDYAWFTALGCAIGAALAPIVARRFDERKLKYAFAAIAILDGCLFIYQSVNIGGHLP